MIKMIFLMVTTVLGINSFAFAHGGEEFFWGTQKTLSGDVECLVKIEDQTQSEVTSGAIAYLLHDQSYVDIKEELLNYDANRNAYIFSSTDSLPEVKQMVLFLDPNGEPIRYAASILHGSHYDPVFCENLKLAQSDDEINAALNFMAQYSGATHDHDAEEGHDHDTEDDHDHDHDADTDHEHQHDHDHNHK